MRLDLPSIYIQASLKVNELQIMYETQFDKCSYPPDATLFSKIYIYILCVCEREVRNIYLIKLKDNDSMQIYIILRLIIRAFEKK